MTFYDFVAPAYGMWAFLVEAQAHRLAREVLGKQSGLDMLEVAVGTALESPQIERSTFRRSVGVDLSMRMLKQARKRLEPGAEGRPWLCQADARTLPFRAASFDAILNCYMIDLLPETDIPVALQEFLRVLRDDGRLVLLTMAEQKPALHRLWTSLYRHVPLLVGGCRPIDAAMWLKRSGWELERKQEISQRGFRSELIVARPGAQPASA